MKLSRLFAWIPVLAVALSAQQAEQPAKEPGKVQRALGTVGRGVDKAVDKTASGAKTAAGATASGAKTAAGATASGAKTAGEATATGAKTAAGATATGAKTAAGGAKTAAVKTKDATEVAGRTTAGATGTGLEKAGETVKKVGMLDINTATEKELEALPGIGDAYAAKIIAGRPYARKNELVDKGVIPQASYDKIKNRVVARQPKS